MAKSVFISYSSRDSKEVKQVTAMLEAAGIPYWKAPEMIPAGSNYAREIPRAIGECEVFLLMISESSQDSIWVEKEIDCAINARKTIVPLKLSEVPLSDMFRFYLNNVQTIFCPDSFEESIHQLRERLFILLGMKETAEKPPAGRLMSEEENPLKGVPPKVLSPIERRRERSNALTLNKKPVICEKCGGNLVMVSRGTYQCVDCGCHHYDSFQKVRNYLEQMGPRPITEIVKATGVPRKSIEYFLRDEMLEIPKGSSILLVCEGCGAPIRTGYLCDRCKEKNVKTSDKKNKDNQYYYFKKKDSRR